MAREKTGIAGEFWFFSQLQRLGYQSFITLGNTKSVDLKVDLSNGKTLTFDVKSKENFSGSYWNINFIEKVNHYYVFVNLAFKKQSNNKRILGIPKCFIVHSENLKYIKYEWRSNEFAFEAKLLNFLKEKDDKIITAKLKNKFKEKHNITEIDFDFYNKIILTLEDFETKFYTEK